MLSKVFTFFDKVLGFVEEWSLFLATMAALIALFFNILLRYAFNFSLSWSEELVREVIILTTFIGCSAAIKARSMIKIDALVQLVGGLKIPLLFFSHFVTLIFAAMMLFYGWKMVMLQTMTHQKTIIMEIPLEYLYAILPIMGGMMFIRTLQMLYLDIRDIRSKKTA